MAALAAFGIVAGGGGRMTAGAPAATAGARLPFTRGKDTTVISTPLLPDGMPDYIAVLNERHGKGVTPETNALIPLLQIRSMDQWMGATVDAGLRARFIAAVGAKPLAADAPTFMTYGDYLAARQIDLTDPYAELNYAAAHFWTAEFHPQLADYLQAQMKFLDLGVEASKRPHLYLPYVSSEGHLSHGLIGWYLMMSTFASPWCARITLRASSGDFDGALTDAIAVKRLARLISTRGDWIDIQIATTYEEHVDESLAAIAASGRLTGAQCDLFTRALALPPLTSMASQDDVDRRMMLDAMMLQATGVLDPRVDVSVRSVEITAVDWNEVLRQFNAAGDREMVLLNAPTIDAMRRGAQAMLGNYDKEDAEFRDVVTFARRVNESPAEYTQRFARWTVWRFFTPVGIRQIVSLEQHRRDSILRARMLDVLLAVGKFKAQTGDWPKTLQDLVPGVIAKIPADPYSTGGAGPLQYDVEGGHPFIISVGPDHKADTADDILVGDMSGRALP